MIHRTVKKFVTAIFQVVTKKCCEIIHSKSFFWLLTDESQTRKTGDDKEMVLLKTDYKGLYEFLKMQFIRPKYTFGHV